MAYDIATARTVVDSIQLYKIVNKILFSKEYLLRQHGKFLHYNSVTIKGIFAAVESA
jgi:hypothetical protein